MARETGGVGGLHAQFRTHDHDGDFYEQFRTAGIAQTVRQTGQEVADEDADDQGDDQLCLGAQSQRPGYAELGDLGGVGCDVGVGPYGVQIKAIKNTTVNVPTKRATLPPRSLTPQARAAVRATYVTSAEAYPGSSPLVADDHALKGSPVHMPVFTTQPSRSTLPNLPSARRKMMPPYKQSDFVFVKRCFGCHRYSSAVRIEGRRYI